MSNSADWITALGTIALAIVAIWQDKIRAWVQSPKLNLTIAATPPDVVKTPLRGNNNNIEFETYWSRLRIENNGSTAARDVEVYALDLDRKNADGTFSQYTPFLPMNLVWANIRTPFMPAISPKTHKFCDLFYIPNPSCYSRVHPGMFSGPHLKDINDKTIISIETEVKSFTGGHLLPPGLYRLKVVVAASNATPITETIEINHTGQWKDDIQTMFRDSIGLKKI